MFSVWNKISYHGIKKYAVDNDGIVCLFVKVQEMIQKEERISPIDVLR